MREFTNSVPSFQRTSSNVYLCEKKVNLFVHEFSVWICRKRCLAQWETVNVSYSCLLPIITAVVLVMTHNWLQSCIICLPVPPNTHIIPRNVTLLTGKLVMTNNPGIILGSHTIPITRKRERECEN